MSWGRRNKRACELEEEEEEEQEAHRSLTYVHIHGKEEEKDDDGSSGPSSPTLRKRATTTHRKTSLKTFQDFAPITCAILYCIYNSTIRIKGLAGPNCLVFPVSPAWRISLLPLATLPLPAPPTGDLCCDSPFGKSKRRRQRDDDDDSSFSFLHFLSGRNIASCSCVCVCVCFVSTFALLDMRSRSRYK